MSVWLPDWSGDVCALVASGPSLTPEAAAALRDKAKIVVVNTSYQRVPFADLLYACDGRWWDWHKGAADFHGIKVTHDADRAQRYGLHRVDLLPSDDPRRHRMVMTPKGTLGRGENGAFQALNLLLQCGACRIMLLGVDFCGQRWHGCHPNGHQGQAASTLARWRDLFDAQAQALKDMGADVVNLSPVSELTAYPKLSLATALARWH